MKFLIFSLLALPATLAYADQGGFINSGGSASGGGGIFITSAVASPAGSLTITCPGVGPASCAGGSFTYNSSDGTTNINAAFTSGTFQETCAGGGKGGHISCGYSFSGYFSGTLSVNGQVQAIVGATSQGFNITTPAGAIGATIYNSAYQPFYYSDSEAILRSDDLMGTNQVSFTAGFYGANGLALDSTGRIYVADTYNGRVSRFDDMNGTNLVSFGTYGSGPGQFNDLSALAVDAAGRIYVADANNSRVTRMDDMNGTNWVAFGTAGSGTGQFGGLTSIALDASGRIYVADAGNARIVRFDDMTGTNWTTLTNPALAPVAVTLDAAGRIYIANNAASQTGVIRVDDMTGANWKSVVTGGGSNGLNSISVDSGGTVLVGGGGVRFVDNMSGTLVSSGAIGPIGTYYVFGVTAVPLPSPRPSAISFTPATLDFSQNAGSASAPQTITIANFGGSPLGMGTISASGGFTQTNNCPGILTAGANCTVSVTFTPTLTGPVTGALAVTDNSGNLGSAQSLVLTGTGTAPAVTVTPASLNFSSQVVNTTSNARNVMLQNTGTGPLSITNVAVTAPFSVATNTCGASVASGSSCAIGVTFTPVATGTATGSLTVTDGVGTQTVTLNGSGVAQATLSATSLNFGNEGVGSSSAARNVTLTNRLSVALTINSIAATGPFAIATNTCAASIAGNGTCTVGVTFTPTAPGAATGTLSFTDTAANSPQTVALSGTGTAPVTTSTSSLNLGSVAVGGTTSARSVSITNHQTVALNIASIVASAGFTIANNGCKATLAASSSCSVSVTFTPTANGTVTGALTFTDDAPNSPQVVTLTGTGGNGGGGN